MVQAGAHTKKCLPENRFSKKKTKTTKKTKKVKNQKIKKFINNSFLGSRWCRANRAALGRSKKNKHVVFFERPSAARFARHQRERKTYFLMIFFNFLDFFFAESISWQTFFCVGAGLYDGNSQGMFRKP